jgi:hypothetical protein
MSSELEARLARIEKRVATRNEKLLVCNCRVETRYHNATCLASILKGMSEICLVHGFRSMGFFMWGPFNTAFDLEAAQFCSCPPHPWRSFQLSGDRTWEGHHAAMRAWRNLSQGAGYDLEEEGRHCEAILLKYSNERQSWMEKTRRRLPSQEEIIKIACKRWRKNGN